MVDVQWIREAERDYPGIIRKVSKRFLEEAAAMVEQTAVREVPVNIGDLRGSINKQVFLDRAEVGSNSEYAEWVEYGTKPHWPPREAIARWAHQKGISPDAVFPIQRKIAREGTEEQPFLRPAIDKNRRNLLKRLAELMRAEINFGRT